MENKGAGSWRIKSGLGLPIYFPLPGQFSGHGIWTNKESHAIWNHTKNQAVWKSRSFPRTLKFSTRWLSCWMQSSNLQLLPLLFVALSWCWFAPTLTSWSAILPDFAQIFTSGFVLFDFISLPLWRWPAGEVSKFIHCSFEFKQQTYCGYLFQWSQTLMTPCVWDPDVELRSKCFWVTDLCSFPKKALYLNQ